MNDNFWSNINDEVTGEFESGGGTFTPIPEGTNLVSIIQEAGWEFHDGDTFISLSWTALQPAEYKNRKIFQKIRVLDSDTKKSDKAKRMLAAIDKNASGGKIFALGRKPTDVDLAKFLIGKQMVIKVGVWEQGEKSGNWVQAVSPKTSNAPQQPKTVVHNVNAEYEDDLPGF